MNSDLTAELKVHIFFYFALVISSNCTGNFMLHSSSHELISTPSDMDILVLDGFVLVLVLFPMFGFCHGFSMI